MGHNSFIYSYGNMFWLVIEPSSGLHVNIKQKILFNCYNIKNSCVYKQMYNHVYTSTCVGDWVCYVPDVYVWFLTLFFITN